MEAGLTMNPDRRPTLPPEIIHGILKNLEKEDLLQNRLICKDWNEQCLEFLRAKGCNIVIDKDNIIEFVQLQESRPSVLPLKLIFWFFMDNTHLKEGLHSLFDVVGDDCIQSFDVGEYSPLDNDTEDENAGNKFLEILALVSNGLVDLDLKNLEVQLKEEILTTITKSLKKSFKFPKLVSYTSYKDRSEEVQNPILFNFLMEKSPNLRDLDVDIGDDFAADIHRKIPMTKLENLSINNFKATPKFLQQVQQSQPPLKVLDIMESGNQTDAEGMLLLNLLESVSSTLETLNLIVGRTANYTLPPLMKLKQLKWFRFSGQPVFQRISQVNFNAKAFPNLESYKIGIDLTYDKNGDIFPSTSLPNFPKLKNFKVCSVCPNADETTWRWRSKSATHKMRFPFIYFYTKQTAKFLNVTEAKFIPHVPYGEHELSRTQETHLEENIGKFTELFPIVQKISLVYLAPYPDGEGSKAEHEFIKLLKRFLMSIHKGNIKDITILNCPRNFLAKALKHMLPLLNSPRDDLPDMALVSHTTDVNIIEDKEDSIDKSEQKLGIINNSVQTISMLPGNEPCTEDKSNLDMSLIASHFPMLAELIIPELWFSAEENEKMEQMEKIKLLLPKTDVFKM